MGKTVYAAMIRGLEEAEPKGMAVAAIKSCCLCGVLLAGMGGGGSWLCAPCYGAIVADPYGPEGEAIRDAIRAVRIAAARPKKEESDHG